MYALKVNGEFIDLPDGFGPEFNRFNPLFQNDGLIKDDYTLTIPAPYTDKNARIFGNPSVIENATAFNPRFEAELWWANMPKLKGQVRIERATDSEIISLYFVSGLSEIAEDVRTKSLRDIMDETIVIHNTDFDKRLKLTYNGTTTGSVSLTVNGKKYDNNSVLELVNAINADVDQTATAVYETEPSEIPQIDTEFVTIIPGSTNELEPFDVGFVQPDFDQNGNIVIEAIWFLTFPTWPTDYNNTYNDFLDNYRGAGADRKLRFLTYANIHEFNPGVGFKEYPIVNLYDSGGLAVNGFINTTPPVGQAFVPEFINQTSLAPQVTIAYILERIETFYNITINYPLIDDYPNANLVVLTPNTLDVPLTYFNRKKAIFFRRDFNINEFVPDVTVNDFLKAIQGVGFQITWDSRERTVTYKNRNPIAASPNYVSTIGRHSRIVDVVNQQQTGITLEHVIDDKDIFIPINGNSDRQKFKIGAGEKRTFSRISIPSLGIVSPFPNNPNRFSGVVISQAVDGNYKFVRLALQEGTSDELSTTFFSPNGYSLHWKEALSLDELGLFDLFWKDWIQMEDNTPSAKVTLYVPEKWVWQPPWERKILIDRNKYFIKSFSVVLREKDTLELDCEIVRVPFSTRTFQSGTGVELKDY